MPDKTPKTAETAETAEKKGQPRAAIEAKTVYLKDASFESPASPQIFGQGEIKPELDVRMTMTHQRIDEVCILRGVN